ncbi:hypothetical protein [Microbacterium sp. NPDC057650]|uniref:hypothetical protein n=1 Tax=unclassified Microbacterium TaxID=2609290 RepID=UPI00366EFE31
MPAYPGRTHERAIAEGADVHGQRQPIGWRIFALFRHRPDEWQRAAAHRDGALMTDELSRVESRGVLPSAKSSFRGLPFVSIEVVEINLRDSRAHAPEGDLEVAAVKTTAVHSCGGSILHGEALPE